MVVQLTVAEPAGAAVAATAEIVGAVVSGSYVAEYAPLVAGKYAYSTPLIVSRVKVTWLPARASEVRLRLPKVVGTIPRSPTAAECAETLNVCAPPAYWIDPDDEVLRPSSHSSICRPDTTGTLRARADATMASAPAELALSVCMFAVNAP